MSRPLLGTEAVSCPACAGGGRIYEANVFGGVGVACGHCHGDGKVSEAMREAWLDQQPITRGEVKKMIAVAVRAVRRPSKPYQPPPNRPHIPPIPPRKP